MLHVQASEASIRSGRADGTRPASGREAARPGLSCIIFPMLYRLQFVAFLACLTLDPGGTRDGRATTRDTDCDRSRPEPQRPHAPCRAARRLAAHLRGRQRQQRGESGRLACGERSGRRAASCGCAWRPRRTVARGYAPAHGPAVAVAAPWRPVRALAARVSGPARLLYLWDEGKGGTQKGPRRARRSAGARRVPLTFEAAAAAAAAQSGLPSWRACNQHRWARREGQHDEFRAGGKEGGDGGVAMRPAAQREHGWCVSRGRGDR